MAVGHTKNIMLMELMAVGQERLMELMGVAARLQPPSGCAVCHCPCCCLTKLEYTAGAGAIHHHAAHRFHWAQHLSLIHWVQGNWMEDKHTSRCGYMWAPQVQTCKHPTSCSCIMCILFHALLFHSLRSGVAGFHKVLTLHTLLQWCPNVVVPDQHLLQPLLFPDRALPSFTTLICDCLQPLFCRMELLWSSGFIYPFCVVPPLPLNCYCVYAQLWLCMNELPMWVDDEAGQSSQDWVLVSPVESW